MDKELEARIRTRAYHIWENDPSPEGKADDHWEEARRQIEAESAAAQQEPVDQSVDRDKAARIAPEGQLQEMPGDANEPPERDKRQRAE
ncbi:DUF2934 domain-containing protein [Paraburkholderia sp. MMS20-SJTN17]|uniref:DUF2934 domain-containing protein n=1 Tax=Paraburkholderia translucens TaxID=2886945 RepID=A0ABS8KD44_9BURK|nr:DUF2934 domain-containing protein [Paraburkholderia sp. MMS20-SJTN17]MCC8402312.1 DUF2934 domain-containing protein [Paraburkholderia sp. MMS20-SJTN17]